MWLGPLTGPGNNAINISLTETLFGIIIIKSVSIGLKSTEKDYIHPFISVFFISLILKSFDILPKHRV